MYLVYMALGWLCGLVLASTIPSATVDSVWIFPFIAGVLIVALLRQDAIPRLVGLCLIALSLGMLRFNAARPPETSETLTNQLASFNDRGQAELIGVINDDPEIRDQNTRLRVEVDSIRLYDTDAVIPITGTAMVYANRDIRYQYGDRVRIRGNPQTPPEFDTFSFRDYLARGGIYTVIFRPQILILAHDTGNPPIAFMFQLKDRARQVIDQALPGAQAALLKGIVLGDDSSMSPDVAEDFRRMNTSHLIAISGSNIAVITALIYAIFGRFMGKWPAALATIAGIALYTLFVGATVSVVRAAIMGSLVILADRFRRQNSALNALALSIWAMTLINPQWIFDLGLILSGLATLALVVYLGPLTRFIENLLERVATTHTAKQTASILADAVLMNLVVQITTLPVILLINGQFTPLSILVNVVVAPVQPWIMTLGLLTVVIGMLVFPVGQLLGLLVGLPLTFTLAIIRSGAAVSPGGQIEITQTTALVYYGFLFGITWYMSQPRDIRQRLRQRVQIATVPLLLVSTGIAILIWIFVLARGNSNNLSISTLAVGEGSAVFIRTPNGGHILIDGGENPSRLLTALGDRMPPYKREIDLLILTTPKAVTISAIPILLDKIPVRQVVYSGQLLPRNVTEALARHDLKPQVVRVGNTIALTDGDQRAEIEILYPTAIPPDTAGSDDAPMLLRFRHGNVSLIYGAEISARGWRALSENPQPWNAAILHLFSNGVERANPPEWLRKVSPAIAIITAEAGSEASMPAANVLSALQAMNTRILRTDQGGSVDLESDGHQILIRRER